MLYVALGRNRGDVSNMRLSDVDWALFVSDVVETVRLSERVGLPDTTAFGESSFGGVPEETCVLVWFDVNTFSGALDEALGVVAKHYGQKSIAYSVSETFFAQGIDKS